jgi:hypothetical protein
MKKKLIPAFVLLLPFSTPASAQGGALDQVPAVVAVKNQLSPLCRAQGRRANFVADFLFSVDATGSGSDRDIYLTGAGFECVSRDPNSQAEPTHPAAGRQWLIVHQPRGGYRLVWSGRSPALFASGDEGLVDQHYRYRWNGRAIVRGRRRD